MLAPVVPITERRHALFYLVTLWPTLNTPIVANTTRVMETRLTLFIQSTQFYFANLRFCRTFITMPELSCTYTRLATSVITAFMGDLPTLPSLPLPAPWLHLIVSLVQPLLLKAWRLCRTLYPLSTLRFSDFSLFACFNLRCCATFCLLSLSTFSVFSMVFLNFDTLVTV